MPLRVEGLTVCIAGRAVVEDVSFELPDAARLAMIGQSGSGKTMTALAILGLTPPGAQVSGSIKLGGRELAGAPDRELAQLRGRAIGTVFQDPLTALDPIRRLGAQVADALSNHYRLSRGERRRRAAQMLDQVGLAGAEGFARRYPHQLSGGQRQRAAIAQALIAGPRLIIADEPTTALDVTVQAEILALFRQLVADAGASLLFVTHDIALLPAVAERAVVMADGRAVEQGAVEELLTAPRHPATRSLIRAARATTFVENLAGAPA